MKVVGISNGQFTGVTVATQANCHDWLDVGHIDNTSLARPILLKIFDKQPDLLLVGGWSRGYAYLLRELKAYRKFPVLGCYHSTLYHGPAFNDDLFFSTWISAYQNKLLEALAFVDPRTMKYFKEVKNLDAVFLPHAFPPQPQVILKANFRIGIVGGTSSTLKNSYGALQVASDYVRLNPGCSIFSQDAYGLPQDKYLEELSKCSVLIHASHLECYSNTVLEAWARGIPVITSKANSGVVNQNPLFKNCSDLELTDNIDPLELYNKLIQVHRSWRHYSDLTYDIYNEIYRQTKIHNQKLFTKVTKKGAPH